MKKISWSVFKEYFPVTMVILFGFVMCYLGSLLIVNHMTAIQAALGPTGAIIILLPLVLGVTLTAFGVAQLMGKIKK